LEIGDDSFDIGGKLGLFRGNHGE